MIQKNPVSLNNGHEQINSIKQLEKLVSTSRILPSILRSKCIKVVHSQKELANGSCFNGLGYGSIFAQKEKAFDTNAKSRRRQEMKQAFLKFNK